MFLDNLEQDYNNHIYLKRAISKILPLLIKSGGNLEVVSCSKCIIVIPLLSSVDNFDSYLVKCSHIVYIQDNYTNSLIITVS